MSVSEHDAAQAAGASLRKAVELLRGDDAADGTEVTQQAVAEAVRALPESPRPGWTAEQETQIQAMVGLIRKVRYLARTNAGWWRKQREWRARQRLVDLAMAGEPELFNRRNCGIGRAT
ncbi:hypothetical protein [Streptomyces sirii]|uniref:hypothetical protein n=1 Tax=Streptomyces sirii TaxID=3127701 RepID=UPI003D364ECD